MFTFIMLELTGLYIVQLPLSDNPEKAAKYRKLLLIFGVVAGIIGIIIGLGYLNMPISIR